MLDMRWFAALLLVSVLGAEPPTPEKTDTPYLIHADNLVETETNEAIDESTEKEGKYAVPGATSPARTPLAVPEFYYLAEKLPPSTLQLYRFETVNGRREIVIRKKKKILAEPYRVSLFLVKDKLVRLRVNDTLTEGEYCLTPDGSNAVFCFTVY